MNKFHTILLVATSIFCLMFTACEKEVFQDSTEPNDTDVIGTGENAAPIVGIVNQWPINIDIYLDNNYETESINQVEFLESDQYCVSLSGNTFLLFDSNGVFIQESLNNC